MDENIKTVFITGTDTGVGKSVFSSYLALKLSSEGRTVAISKPIQTGTPKDTDFLKELTENKIPIFNTYSFNLGAAPSVAADAENKVIDVEKIVNDIRNLEKKFDCVIVEGIGGIAVPIVGVCGHKPLQVADLIKALNYPVIIVAHPSLGTINHTILTIEFAKQKGLSVLGFVISGYDDSTDDLVVKTAPDVISMATGIKCLYKLPKLSNVCNSEIKIL